MKKNKDCRDCETDCYHAGKRNPFMNDQNVCNSHSRKDTEPNKPRSGFIDLDDFDLPMGWVI